MKLKNYLIIVFFKYITDCAGLVGILVKYIRYLYAMY